MAENTRAIYGVSSKAEIFSGSSYTQIADQIHTWNANAIFIKNEPEEFINTLHQKNIKVYREYGFFQGENHWKSHPESRPVTDKGEPYPKIEWYAGVCPNQKWLREKHLKEIEDILKRHEVDGIWLDFIRYPVHWEVYEPELIDNCFCPVCLNLFSTDTGITFPSELKTTSASADWILNNHPDEWSEWKCEKISDYVKQIHDQIKKIKPECLVGLFGVPWKDSERNDAIHRIVGQDYSILKDSVDVFSPMVYHLMCNESPQWIGEITEYIDDKTGKPVWPIIQACSVPKTMAGEEVALAVKIGLKPPSKGVIIFAFNHVVKEKTMDFIKNTWEPIDKVKE